MLESVLDDIALKAQALPVYSAKLFVARDRRVWDFAIEFAQTGPASRQSSQETLDAQLRVHEWQEDARTRLCGAVEAILPAERAAPHAFVFVFYAGGEPQTWAVDAKGRDLLIEDVGLAVCARILAALGTVLADWPAWAFKDAPGAPTWIGEASSSGRTKEIRVRMPDAEAAAAAVLARAVYSDVGTPHAAPWTLERLFAPAPPIAPDAVRARASLPL